MPIRVSRRGGTPIPVNKVHRRREAIETSDADLREEVRRAELLCKEEEDQCSSADSLDDPDYEDDTESSSDGSYESEFIDDEDADDEDAIRAIEFARRRRY